MSKSYQHSVVFDKFKVTQEAIVSNLTSLQYLQTLDYLLWKALEPIARECPSLYFNYLAKVTARQSLKASAKLTSDDRTKLPIHLFNILTSKDSHKAFTLSKLMYINRGIMFGFTSFFRNKLTTYSTLQSGVNGSINSAVRRTLIHRIERSLGVQPNGNLDAAIKQVIHWDDKARQWKSMIVQKYTRLALLQAQSTYKDFNHYIELNDVVQIYMLVVNRAIDRCDARQGVLTTFIQNWFKSARSEISEMSKNQTDESYESLVEDHGDAAHETLGVTMPDSTLEMQQSLAYLSKQSDPDGVVRISLQIPEFISLAQLKILESHKL